MRQWCQWRSRLWWCHLCWMTVRYCCWNGWLMWRRIDGLTRWWWGHHSAYRRWRYRGEWFWGFRRRSRCSFNFDCKKNTSIMVWGISMSFGWRIGLFIGWKLEWRWHCPFLEWKMFDHRWRIFPTCWVIRVGFSLNRRYVLFCLINRNRGFVSIYPHICIVGWIGSFDKIYLRIRRSVLVGNFVVGWIAVYIVHHVVLPSQIHLLLGRIYLADYRGNYQVDNFVLVDRPFVDCNLDFAFLDLEDLEVLVGLVGLVSLVGLDAWTYRFLVRICCNYRRIGTLEVDVMTFVWVYYWDIKILIILIFI